MLGKGRQTTLRTTGAKASWACLIGTLTFCLWGANALPIQNVQYQLVTNLAISQHRMPMLQKLQGQSEFALPGIAVPLSSLEILNDENRSSIHSNSELRSVRVRIRCLIRSDIKDIESALGELTIPSLETDECKAFASQLNKEKWLLESCKHSLRRLELDFEHDKMAIETNETHDVQNTVAQATQDSVSSSPFHLTSFGARETVPQSQSLLIDNLRHLVQARSENLDSMSQTLDRLKAKSRGFLSLTGSPSLEPVVRPLTGARLFVLLLLCALVWFILMFWLNPALGGNLMKRKYFPAKTTSNAFSKPASSAKSATTNIDRTIHWMRREGIPYLGDVQVFVDDSVMNGNAPFAASQTPTSEAIAKRKVKVHAASNQTTGISEESLNWLRSLSEGSLVLWIGLFAARFMFDPHWRELVSMAPLAAITRMISGIQ